MNPISLQSESLFRKQILFIFFCLCICMLFGCNSSTSSENTDEDPQGTDDDADNDDMAVLSPDYTAFSVTSPVAAADFTVASTFGPRLKSSEDNRYDFHRGIDIIGERGDSIFAIADGTIYKVYDEGSTAYPNSGRVVIVEHTLQPSIEFQETTLDSFYSLYAHLDGFSAKAQEVLDSGVPQSVSQGELLGQMGDSGVTDLLHLHLEIRLQTICSLEYQLEHLDADCAEYGFDPHINPMDLFVSQPASDAVYDLQLTTDDSTLNIVATAARPYFNVDGVEIAIYTDASESELLWEKKLSYNSRESFDATSTTNLDTAQLTSVLVEPQSLGAALENYEIHFAVDLSDLDDAGFARVSLQTTRGVVQEETLDL